MSGHRRRGAALLAGLVALGGLWPLLRPNRSEVRPDLGLDVWPAVADGAHNSNTDLIHWRGAFWLVHAAAPWHFASPSTRLRLWRSEDARTWVPVTDFQNPGEDIRDPKFAAIGERLFLYWLNNRHFPEPEPHRSEEHTSELQSLRHLVCR